MSRSKLKSASKHTEQRNTLFDSISSGLSIAGRAAFWISFATAAAYNLIPKNNAVTPGNSSDLIPSGDNNLGSNNFFSGISGVSALPVLERRAEYSFSIDTNTFYINDISGEVTNYDGSESYGFGSSGVSAATGGRLYDDNNALRLDVINMAFCAEAIANGYSVDYNDACSGSYDPNTMDFGTKFSFSTALNSGSFSDISGDDVQNWMDTYNNVALPSQISLQTESGRPLQSSSPSNRQSNSRLNSRSAAQPASHSSSNSNSRSGSRSAAQTASLNRSDSNSRSASRSAAQSRSGSNLHSNSRSTAQTASHSRSDSNSHSTSRSTAKSRSGSNLHSNSRSAAQTASHSRSKLNSRSASRSHSQSSSSSESKWSERISQSPHNEQHNGGGDNLALKIVTGVVVGGSTLLAGIAMYFYNRNKNTNTDIELMNLPKAGSGRQQ